MRLANLGCVPGGGWPISGKDPYAECVEIYLVADGQCALVYLGCVLGIGWPISGLPATRRGRVKIYLITSGLCAVVILE